MDYRLLFSQRISQNLREKYNIDCSPETVADLFPEGTPVTKMMGVSLVLVSDKPVCLGNETFELVEYETLVTVKMKDEILGWKRQS